MFDFIDASLFRPNYPAHIPHRDVTLFYLSSLTKDQKRLVKERLCKSVEHDLKTFKDLCVAMVQAYDNDNVVLAIDFSTQDIKHSEDIEVIAVVAGTKDMTFIAILYNCKSNILRPDHAVSPFSETFATQMKLRNFEVSPLSDDPQESLLMYITLPTDSYIKPFDILSGFLTPIESTPGEENFACWFYDITSVKSFFNEEQKMSVLFSKECVNFGKKS